jgi:1-acyl-sn-glycerol-3-phosphate acyltransferase
VRNANSESDGDAQRRAADAIAQLASRLTAQQAAVGDADDAHGSLGSLGSLVPKARRYSSADHYIRRWGERGMRSRADRVDDFGLDRTYEASVRPFFELMANKYFRVEIEGVKNVPSQGRALLIGNHSGTLPWDGVMLRTALRQHHPLAREMRWLVEDYIYHAPFLGSFVNRIGAVRACQENAQRLLENEELVAVFPEGIKGIAKHWSQRYQLQRFGRGGYVKLALRTGAPVIPVAIVGAEETYPLLHMAKAFSKVIGMPFLPVTPTFPLLGPLGLAPLPSRWRIVIGEPVRELDAHTADDARDEVLIGELNQRVRMQVDALVQAALAARGKRVFV